MDVGAWFMGVFNNIGAFFGSCFTGILSILPDSPFVMLDKIPGFSDIMGYVNYFIPFDFAVSTLTAWLVAVGTFYLWQLLLRWIKAIE